MDSFAGMEVIAMNNDDLEPNKEKRLHQRSDCKGMIKWSYYNQSNGYDGKLLNFSPKGFYFETSQAVKTGATIFIQFTKYFPENLSSDDKALMRNVCFGKVKHCNEIQKSDATRYGVGIKYIFQY